MTLKKVRADHHQRAVRLEARFSPTWTGDPTEPTVTLLPNTPAQPSAPAVQSTPSAPAPVSQPTTVASAVPTTVISVAVVQDATTPVVSSTPSSVVPTTTSSSTSAIAPLVTSTSSTSSVAQTTPLIVASPTSSRTVAASPSTYRSLPLTSLSPATISSPSPSSTSAAASGMASGSIIGIVAAGVVAVVVIGVLGIWLLKRRFNSRDLADGNSQFQRHSWMRNSVALPDEMPSPLVRGPSETPRPPTMIERKQTHNFSNLAASRAGNPQNNNIGMAYSDYPDSPYGAAGMPSFRPGEHLSMPSPNSAQPFFSPIGPPSPASPGMMSFDETAPAMRHASYNTAAGVPVYFSRHDSNISAAQPDSAALPMTPSPRESAGMDADGYATLDRTSVTPYQAQQYAEISKQLETAQALAPVPEDEHGGPEAIAQEHDASPFEDPAHGAQEYQELTVPAPVHPRVDSTPPILPPMRALSPVGAVGAHASFAQIAQAFPAAPSGPAHPAFPAAAGGSPKASSFKQSPPPLSPVVGAQKGQVVSVPESAHAGRETPVQFGFNTPAEPKAVRRVSVAASAKRTSAASRKSLGKSGRPETLYDEEDAYGGF